MLGSANRGAGGNLAPSTLPAVHTERDGPAWPAGSGKDFCVLCMCLCKCVLTHTAFLFGDNSVGVYDELSINSGYSFS